MTTRITWTEVAEATEALLATGAQLPEGSQSTPSLCDGWTRGHVLTHLARNADALGNLVTWARTGVPTPMYASAEARDAAIDAGSARSIAELVADLAESSRRLAEAGRTLGPEHDAVTLELRGGVIVHGRDIAWRRLREVAYHHIDLDAGFGFADLPTEVVLAFLAFEARVLGSDPDAPSVTLRTTEGELFTIGGGAAYVDGSAAALLGWLARGLDDGVAAPGGLPLLPKGS